MLPRLDAGSDRVKPTWSCIIQNLQTFVYCRAAIMRCSLFVQFEQSARRCEVVTYDKRNNFSSVYNPWPHCVRVNALCSAEDNTKAETTAVWRLTILLNDLGIFSVTLELLCNERQQKHKIIKAVRT